jgi:TrwC relaxase
MAAALALIEDHAALTRTGAGGLAQIATRGLTAAAFRHHDSRDSDPNLHTHVVVSNKVKGVDGVWRALDARVLPAMKAAASDTYNTQLTARVRAYTGADVTPKVTRAGREPVWEVAGIPAALIDHFSTRRADIVPLIEELELAYRREHGKAPDAAARQAIGRQATLATRAPKKDPKPLPALRAEWVARARAGFGRDVIDRIAAIAPGPRGRQLTLDLDQADTTVNKRAGARASRVPGPAPRSGSGVGRVGSPWRCGEVPGGAVTVPAHLADLAADLQARAGFVAAVGAAAVARVAEGRSTWTRWNVHAATQRILRDPDVYSRLMVAEPAPERLSALVEEAVTAALDVHCVRLTPDPAISEPKALRRADGASVSSCTPPTGTPPPPSWTPRPAWWRPPRSPRTRPSCSPRRPVSGRRWTPSPPRPAGGSWTRASGRSWRRSPSTRAWWWRGSARPGPARPPRCAP